MISTLQAFHSQASGFSGPHILTSATGHRKKGEKCFSSRALWSSARLLAAPPLPHSLRSNYSLKVLNVLWPQGLCTCFLLCLECSFLKGLRVFLPHPFPPLPSHLLKRPFLNTLIGSATYILPHVTICAPCPVQQRLPLSHVPGCSRWRELICANAWGLEIMGWQSEVAGG